MQLFYDFFLSEFFYCFYQVFVFLCFLVILIFFFSFFITISFYQTSSLLIVFINRLRKISKIDEIFLT